MSTISPEKYSEEGEACQPEKGWKSANPSDPFIKFSLTRLFRILGYAGLLSKSANNFMFSKRNTKKIFLVPLDLLGEVILTIPFTEDFDGGTVQTTSEG